MDAFTTSADLGLNVIRRLRSELTEFKRERHFGIVIKSHVFSEDGTSRCQWNVQMSGLTETLWENLYFDLMLEFPFRYPESSPTVKFESDPFHPNVYSNGNVCLDILQPEFWDSSYTALSILRAIQAMLSDPYPDIAANHNAAKLYMTDRLEYEKTVKRYYANGGTPSLPHFLSEEASSTSKSKSTTSKRTFALARIVFGLLKVKKEGLLVDGISVDELNEQLLSCYGVISGKTGTPYEDGTFRFKIQFPDDYPFTAPNVRFLSRIIFHPNVSSDRGKVAMHLLSEAAWSPSVGLDEVLNSLHWVLHKPDLNDAKLILNEAALHLILKDKTMYENSIRHQIKKFKTGLFDGHRRHHSAPGFVLPSPSWIHDEPNYASSKSSNPTYSNTNKRRIILLRRIEQDLQEIAANGLLLDGISVEKLNEKDLTWSGIISGKPGTPFENGIFRFEVQFSEQYPFTAPNVKFLSRNIFHPNVSRQTGKVALAMLKNDWTPCTNLSGILNSLLGMLNKPHLYEAKHILNENAVQLIQKDETIYAKFVCDLIEETT